MNQDQLLAKRDELVREYHLGKLELYCTPMTARGWAIFGAWLFGVSLVVGALVLIISGHALDLSLIALFAIIIVVIGCCLPYILISLFGPTSVYVYTGGLVCLRRSGGRVILWEEIRKAWILRGGGDFSDTFYVDLNDKTRIRFPTVISQGSASREALQKFIEEKMVQASRAPDK